MASYQQIESRLDQIERKLDFVMRAGSMKVAIDTGLIDANGNPAMKHLNGSLLEIYHLANQLPSNKIGTIDGPAESSPESAPSTLGDTLIELD